MFGMGSLNAIFFADRQTNSISSEEIRDDFQLYDDADALLYDDADNLLRGI